ncbi:FAD-binding domain-containing protein [Cutaneotrichosporon oleaginosum]|uniref:D-lactate dehydrogenase (cytochrome) n=1 Tax=Cutaneotrichosporon oleaginosum TaxID=879819 RepID=A0A0J0XV59_9TREE|nr:FAD-binding domain-containing protein [Cutaneotrichosporon oleaginosum]KLT44948.1 FAD-binding domain-containing protein [Cutaneotrichosporon oleaginosum]TXT09637.1 hypothetical protein COLE_03571 [Cutaneotrichosporon oleaginosum]
MGGLAGAALTYAALSLNASAEPGPAPAPASIPTPAAPKQGAARFGSPDDYRAAIAEIRTLLLDDVTTDESDREAHAANEWFYGPQQAPCAVVFPHSTADVQAIVRICAKYRVPIIPYGAGTGLEGHFSAPFGGVCVNLGRHMDKIVAVHPMDGDVVVQAGIGYETLNKALADAGHALFFPLDPGPNASVAGMLSTGCSGPNALRYGSARAEWFINVTAVLADGTVVKTRQRAKKSSTGPDMTKLFIGAEGTLGIVTEATLRLTPKLPTRVAVISFPSVAHAVQAVVDVVNQGVNVQCAELLDSLFVQAANHLGIVPNPLPEKDTIFFKLQGTDAMMVESERLIREIAERNESIEMRMAHDDKESDALWAARKGALYAALAHSGYETPMLYGNDACVPLSALPQFVADCQKEMKDRGIYGPIVAHLGDGTVHSTVIFNSHDELPAMHELISGFVKKAIALDGTCTGEHGVGQTKKKYLPSELGDGTCRMLRTIKDTLDPLGIMNPGKLYPDEPDAPGQDANYAPPPPACCA